MVILISVVAYVDLFHAIFTWHFRSMEPSGLILGHLLLCAHGM